MIGIARNRTVFSLAILLLAVLPRGLRVDRNEAHEIGRKLFNQAVVPDAEPESHQYLRVIDEDGEDYWYPKSWFHVIDLPQPVERALLSVK